MPAETEIAEKFRGLSVNIGKRSRRIPHRVSHVRTRLNGKADIFLNAQADKQIGDLKRTADAGPRDIFWPKSPDGPSFEVDRPAHPAGKGRITH